LGSSQQYLELEYIHVSRDFRGQGIGQKLFQGICQAARMRGAQKLYIGAHPAVETQAFYATVGCISAQEIVLEIYQREPRDLQLEYVL
jgi:GNAT superfamily N-acetyltransferase